MKKKASQGAKGKQRKTSATDAATKPAKPVKKVGFVVECCEDGADQKVIEHVIRAMNLELTPIFRFTRSKRFLFEDCGKLVESLFKIEGCSRVFVVWDLLPCNNEFHDKGKPSCVMERDYLRRSLPEDFRGREKTVMLCITHELENWLLADGAALTAVLSRDEHKARAIPDDKKPEKDKNPKGILKKLFDQVVHTKFIDTIHVPQIISKVKDLSKLDRAPSFKRLREQLARS